jgi:hypothetical protein
MKGVEGKVSRLKVQGSKLRRDSVVGLATGYPESRRQAGRLPYFTDPRRKLTGRLTGKIDDFANVYR